jgi:hypothetical protein
VRLRSRVGVLHPAGLPEPTPPAAASRVEATAGNRRIAPGEVHLHFHGVTPEDIAAVISQHRHAMLADIEMQSEITDD